MKYMLMLFENEAPYGGPEKNGPALMQSAGRHMAFVEELGDRRVFGAGLKGTASATTVRRADGRQTIHDGPFAEAKEQLGGFYVIDVPDLDTAIEIARRMPMTGDGSVEIRPLLAFE